MPSMNSNSPELATPVPDPTTLTTQQLESAIVWLKDLLRAEIHGRAELVDLRFGTLDHATELQQKGIDRIPLLVDDKITALRTLHSERFASIQTQFQERDTRTEQTSRDSKVAVDAALQAAKEAVGEQNKSSALAIAKSEASTNKQIDQIAALVVTTTAGINDKIGDVKDRLTRIESLGIGKSVEHDANRDRSTSMVGIVGLIVGSAIGLGGLAFSMSRGKPEAPQVVYLPAPAAAAVPPVTVKP